MKIPQSVIEQDRQLDGVAEHSTEELARHRWHQTLDPDGPGYSITAYAAAVGKGEATIRRYVNGFVSMLTNGGTITDALATANMSGRKRAVAETLADVDGVSAAVVVKRRNNTGRSVANITEQAEERVERSGQPVTDEAVAAEARAIAERQKQTREMEARNESNRKSKSSLRFISIEGKLAGAKRKVSDALAEAEGVDFTDEEMELLRSTVSSINAILTLLDLRMAGTPDIDWDAELEKIGGRA